MEERLRKSLLIHPDELDSTWIRNAKSVGADVLALHPVGGTTAHESLAELVELLKTNEYRAKLDAVADAGLEIEYEMHALRYLLPSSEFERHPEYFRMNADGQRTTDRNLCATNEAALIYIADSAEKLAKSLYRSTHRYFFWTDDALDAFCHCEKCRNFTPSEQQMLIMNAMLEGIRRFDPDARLAYLAYADSRSLPERVKPTGGIFLEFAPMDRDYHIAINDASSEKNRRQCENLKPLLELFGAENTKVLEYWLDNSMFSGWKKPQKRFTPDEETIAADAEYYGSLGIRDLSTFACYLGEDYRKLYGMPDIEPFARIQ